MPTRNFQIPAAQAGELQEALDEMAQEVRDYHGSTKAEIDQMKVEIAKLSRGGSVIHGNFGPSVIAAALGTDALAALRDKRTREAMLPFDASLASIRAAVTNDGQAGSIVTGTYVQAGIVGVPGRPLMLLDLLPAIAITFGSAQYNRLTSAFAYAADVQSEQGDTKATQTLPTEVVTATIATIASVSAISEQALSDAPVLQQQIGSLLNYGAMRKLEMQIVSGSGVGENIEGLKTAGTAFSASSGLSSIDKVSECAASMQDAGWNPSAVIVNAMDWHETRTAKATGSGEYLSGAFDKPALPNMWGLPVVTSPAVDQGTAIVVDTSQLLVLDRQQPIIALGRENDDFSRNILKVRGELRAGLMILATAAVQVVTL